MLDLYRVGREQRDEILTVLKTNRERLFVPYQAAYEFQKNRLSVAGTAVSAYEDLRDSLALGFDEKLLSQIRDPLVLEEIRTLLDAAIETAQQALDDLRDAHTIPFDKVTTDDPIRVELDALLVDPGQVGKPPSPEDLKAREDQFKQRAASQVPPGYLDADKKKGASGDYLIWVELLAHAKASKRPLLFITNDRKNDWYRPTIRETEGGPRAELVAEMRATAPKCPYHQVPLDRFLELAVEHLDASVDEATIEAIERISRSAVVAPETTYPDNLISSIGPNILENYPGLSPAMMAASTRYLDPVKVSGYGGYDPNLATRLAANSLSAQAGASIRSALSKYDLLHPGVDVTAWAANQDFLSSFRKLAESAYQGTGPGAYTTGSAAEQLRRAAIARTRVVPPTSPSETAAPAKKAPAKKAPGKKAPEKKPTIDKAAKNTPPK